ncbi:MerR family transcriptional regulator [Bacillus sp. Y1]|nr:MerR family transcriptional regulator [Bacillus sp. Y1]
MHKQRWYNGVFYRIGELASIAKVSRRTIDYYTNLGLLHADRSKGNYRLYNDEALEALHFIEECKEMHIPLEEIKRKLEMKKQKDVKQGEMERHIHSIGQQMKQLQHDISVLIPLIENLDGQQTKVLSEELTMESEWLMKFLPEFHRLVKFSN